MLKKINCVSFLCSHFDQIYLFLHFTMFIYLFQFYCRSPKHQFYCIVKIRQKKIIQTSFFERTSEFVLIINLNDATLLFSIHSPSFYLSFSFFVCIQLLSKEFSIQFSITRSSQAIPKWLRLLHKIK